MKKLRIAYFGSPDFSAFLLEKILLDKNLPVEVKLVVTQPDSPVGRKQVLTPTPVKKVAGKYKKSITEKSQVDLKDIDLALVYAFGELIPKELLSMPKFGFWNIHPSLLPKYRGPSPITSTLINGDVVTGVTLIKMDEEIDHGPIIAQESLTIDQFDRRPDLEKKLTELGFEMFKKIIDELIIKNHELKTRPQNHKLATFTNKLKKDDGFILFENWKLKIGNSPDDLFNLFRGLSPWPGLWMILPNGKRLKITDVDFIGGKLILKKVQLEGKKEVDFETFNRAYKIF